MRLLLATSNPAKLARLRWLLEGMDVEPVALSEAGEALEVDEGDDSFKTNAERKAQAWARRHELPALATDGGVVVPALGDRWNEVRTRRAAGPAATDAERAAHLLALMHHLEGRRRCAVRHEAAALARADGRVFGSWEAVGSSYEVARTYDPRGVPAGFWLPGLLLFGPRQRRYGDLAEDERLLVDDQWTRLRPLVRAGVVALSASRFVA